MQPDVPKSVIFAVGWLAKVRKRQLLTINDEYFRLDVGTMSYGTDKDNPCI